MLKRWPFIPIVACCVAGFVMCAGNVTTARKPVGDYPIQPVAFTKVHLADDFLKPPLLSPG